MLTDGVCPPYTTPGLQFLPPIFSTRFVYYPKLIVDTQITLSIQNKGYSIQIFLCVWLVKYKGSTGINSSQYYHYILGHKKSSDTREQLGIFNINAIRNKLEGTYTKNRWQQTTQKKFKLQTWREKKYRKTTNEIGRWLLGGRNRPRGLSLLVDDDTIISFK